MSLKVDTDSEDYKFLKTLNEDVKITPNVYGKYDLSFENGDYVNVSGKQSLQNAIVIAVMTRFNELEDIPLYEGFGCCVHELIKARQSEMVRYNMELFITDVLNDMRRVKEITSVEITDLDGGYKVNYRVVNINDELVAGSVVL